MFTVPSGIDRMLPEEVTLVHGPGCPVCVTPLEQIERALAIARRPQVIFTSFGELPDSQSPLMKKYKKAHDQFAPKDRWGVFFWAGFYFVEPMVEGLKRCGRDLTRERFVQEMEGIRNFQGISGKISYKPFDINDASSRPGCGLDVGCRRSGYR